MKTDYPELEGKIIRYNYGGYDEDVKVVGCNYHIGITFVSATDNNDYFLCLNGASSPKRDSLDSFPKMNYRKLFHAIVKAAKRGEYTEREAMLFYSSHKRASMSNPTKSSCPWGQ